jgi:hypothetical protein
LEIAYTWQARPPHFVFTSFKDHSQVAGQSENMFWPPFPNSIFNCRLYLKLKTTRLFFA